jgi:uncharacterized protein YraI/LysM repeat protein
MRQEASTCGTLDGTFAAGSRLNEERDVPQSAINTLAGLGGKMIRRFFKRFVTLLMVGISLGVAAPAAVAQAAPVEQSAANCTQYHTVRRGENLYRIALLYDTTYQALQRLNNLPNANYIRVGQRLCVRTGAGAPNEPDVKPTPHQFIMALHTVNIRRGPGTRYAIIGRLSEGQTARVTGISQDKGWWRVLCPDDRAGSCWVSADSRLTRPIEEPTQVNEATVTSISVDVRESHPVQVVATVRGHLANGCVYIDTFRHDRQGNTFRIELTTGRNPGMCTEALVPFELSVKLDTAGLATGHYVVAADTVQTSFVLHR